MLISSSFLLFKIHTVQLSIIRTGNLVGLLRSVISLKPCYTFSENGSVNTNPLCLVVSPVLYTIGLWATFRIFFLGAVRRKKLRFWFSVRPWDACFWGNGEICVTQSSCNLSYLIRQRQDHQKTILLKVFIT